MRSSGNSACVFTYFKRMYSFNLVAMMELYDIVWEQEIKGYSLVIFASRRTARLKDFNGKPGGEPDAGW